MSNGLYYVSSLKINLEKSELNEGFQLDNELGCRRGSFHTNYLGTQFGAQSKAISMWDLVKEGSRRD